MSLGVGQMTASLAHLAHKTLFAIIIIIPHIVSYKKHFILCAFNLHLSQQSPLSITLTEQVL